MDESNNNEIKIEKEIELSSEMSDNEDIISELEECLQSKEATLSELKKEAEDLQKDIHRYTTPYDSENCTLEEDIAMLCNIASKYVKADLLDFYVDRIRKSAANEIDSDSSTISELCKLISKNQS